MSLLSDIMVRGHMASKINRREEVPPEMEEPVAVKCHEIARGFYVDTAENGGAFSLEEGLYGRLMDLDARPPFPIMWMEWGLPLDMEEVGSGKTWREVKDGVLIADRDGYFHAIYFCENPGGGMPICLGATTMKTGPGSFKDRIINADLTPIGKIMADVAMEENDKDSPWPDDMVSVAANYLNGIGSLYLTDVAIRMMHVKNVEVVEQATKRRKKQRRIRPDEAIRWNTIRVRPQGKQYRDAEGTGLPTMTAHHVVRGHFAKYTPEKPLFGKYVGTFWREAHTRGDKTAGEIAKDYEVAA
jgi:hypothetical protein